MEAQIANQLLKAATLVEQKLDDELNKLDNLDDDDLEAIRRKRLAEMRKAQDKKQVLRALITSLKSFLGVAWSWSRKIN